MDRYWSTPFIPVVFGAISEVTRSNCVIPMDSQNVEIFGASKISPWSNLTFGRPSDLIF